MDDFSGDWLVGPIHPKKMTHITEGQVTIKRFSQIGCHCVVFPNLTIEQGCVVGAMSLVSESLDEWGIYVGVPCKFLKGRKKNMVSLQY